MKFKFGDRVVVIKNHVDGLRIGDTGTLMQNFDDNCLEFKSQHYKSKFNYCYNVEYYQEHFELYERKIYDKWYTADELKKFKEKLIKLTVPYNREDYDIEEQRYPEECQILVELELELHIHESAISPITTVIKGVDYNDSFDRIPINKINPTKMEMKLSHNNEIMVYPLQVKNRYTKECQILSELTHKQLNLEKNAKKGPFEELSIKDIMEMLYDEKKELVDELFYYPEKWKMTEKKKIDFQRAREEIGDVAACLVGLLAKLDNMEKEEK
jgi:hypothetical protein